MKKIKSLSFVILSLLAIGVGASSAFAASPSSGATVQDRKMPVDGAGVPYYQDSFLGYKVFETTATTAIQVVDEAGNAPTAGLLHQVCISTGAASDGIVVFDSNTATGFSYALVGKALAPAAVATTTAISCAAPNLPLDVQFNNGLVLLLNSNTTGNEHAYVYWRPARGGRN